MGREIDNKDGESVLMLTEELVYNFTLAICIVWVLAKKPVESGQPQQLQTSEELKRFTL